MTKRQAWLMVVFVVFQGCAQPLGTHDSLSISGKAQKTWVVTTLAGSTTYGSTDGTGTAASFHDPAGVAVDSSGNL
jgi:hypothetical protein